MTELQNKAVCKGSIQLGTACMKCDNCQKALKEYNKHEMSRQKPNKVPQDPLKEKLGEAFGDGWYDGFRKAYLLVEQGKDLSDYCKYTTLLMAEDAEYKFLQELGG